MEVNFNTIAMLFFSILIVIIILQRICDAYPIQFRISKFAFVASIVLVILMAAIIEIGFIVFYHGEPNINEKEDTYEIIGRTERYHEDAIYLRLFVEDPNDTEGITYSNGQKTIEEKISRMPKAYDVNSDIDYVAKLKCYFGPFYTFRDCYIYGNKTQQGNT